MLDYTFCSPTVVVFGRGREKEAGALSAKHLGDRVLLHYGEGSVVRSGLLGRVKDSLEAAGLSVTELGGAKPNPVLSLVHEGIALCREKDITGILAVGGGSAIDSAKAIAMGVCYDGDVWDFYEGRKPERALPVGVVLTLAASGSETSAHTVITNEATLVKRGKADDCLRPKFAVLNPELTCTLPPFQTACGIVDIMAHAMERYFTNTRHVELTDRLCEATIRTMVTEGPKAMQNPDDYDARAEIMFAGSIAHNDIIGLGRVGDWASHKLGHELSALFGTAHGAALAIMFPAWMKHVYRHDIPRFAQFASRIFEVEHQADSEAMALEGIARYERFVHSLGLNTRMSDEGIDTSRIGEMADRLVAAGPVGTFVPVDRELAVKIYTTAI